MNKITINDGNVQKEAIVRRFIGLTHKNFLSALAYSFAKGVKDRKSTHWMLVSSVIPQLENTPSLEEATILFKNKMDTFSLNPRECQKEFFFTNKMILPSYFNRRDFDEK